MSLFQKSAIAGAVFATTALFSGAAQADCWVDDKEDSRGSYKTQFQGSSVAQIWPYCKKFIERTVASKGIEDGEFGMNCYGRLTCNIRGEIVNGKVKAPTGLKP